MSLALARKYRPSTFDDLVGQDSVSQTLSLALDGDRLSHAYLFSGLRGSGKTSTARIFAKALLCEKGASSHPCNECDSCKMANENRHIDIIEMDAASNRGIDDIKELIEHTKYKPSIGRYKIFIIDEVHMLTPQAFNALLKTLEEPPDFVKFILATTDPLKLPATILSRTQHFRFKKIPQKLILSHLETILDKENIEYEREAIDIIARNGAGSLRDSLTLLDQAIVYSKNHIDIATITNMLGIIDPALLNRLLDSLLAKNETEILEFIKTASEYESEMVIDELTLHLKELLFAKDRRFSPLIIDRFFRILADSKELLSLGSDGEFVLTLTLFKMLEALSLKEIDGMIKTLTKDLSGIETKTPEKVVDIPEVEQEDKEKNSAPEIDKPTLNEPAATDSNQLKFKALIEKLYDRNYDVGKCFESNIAFESFQNNELTWHSSAENEDKKILINNWSIIKLFVQDIFGFDTKIINIPKKKALTQEDSQKTVDEKALSTKRNKPTTNKSHDGDGDTDITSTAKTKSNEEPQMKGSCIAPDAGDVEAAKEKDPSELLKEPMVDKMIELFQPKKVRIKPKI